MLVWLSNIIGEYFNVFYVFHYITLRSILAALTALIICLLFGSKVIKILTKLQFSQVIRTSGPKSHLEKKSGTPTMGGVLILFSVTISTLLWGDLKNYNIWILLLVTILFGLIGWVDDYRKIILNDSKGLPGRWKYFFQSVIGLITGMILYKLAVIPAETNLYVPFFKNFFIPLGIFFIIFSYFVIVGSSNAVNLTDGLDGLAILPTVMISGALGIFAYVTGHINFAGYLVVPYIPNVSEITIFCSAIVGAGLGFLWFNAYPAQIFMGDVGSLGLGASLGLISVMIRQELVLFIMGGVFVVETISVIVQVIWFKLTGKRFFKMAPIHHHFELVGWPEPKIIVRFWIITVVLVLIGLATLKLR